MSHPVTQVMLRRNLPDGSRLETVVWTDSDKRLKVGARVRLDGETEFWDVAAVYAKTESKYLHDDWCVGGIFSNPFDHYEEGCCR